MARPTKADLEAENSRLYSTLDKVHEEIGDVLDGATDEEDDEDLDESDDED